MYATQKQVLESFVRVRAFLEAHPATGRLTYAAAQSMLDDALQPIRTYAGQQVSGRVLSRSELARQQQLIRRLRDEHMRPIVTIARAQIEPESDAGLPAAFRLPRFTWVVTKVLQASDGMIEVARSFEAVFLAQGMPPDFLARFQEARDELARVFAARAALIGTHVGARAGLPVELRRGRRAVDRLDAVVRAAYGGDEAMLAAWRAAKRVHRLPSGAGARVREDASVLEAEQGVERGEVMGLLPGQAPGVAPDVESAPAHGLRLVA